MILCLGLAGTVALAAQLAGPAAEWVQQAPRQMRQIARDVRDFTKPVQQANQAAENFARAAGGEGARGIQIVRTQLDDPYKSLTRTPKLAASVLAVVLLTFFFMVYGESLQRHAIALLPNRQQQRFTTEIMLDIEREVSRYVLTISVINMLVGLVFAGILYLLKIPLPEALLWGHRGGAAEFRAVRGPADRRDADVADGLCGIPHHVVFAAAGHSVSSAAYHRRPGGHPDRAGPAHGDLATDVDPGVDAVWLALGHGRPAAGGAAAGVHQDGAQPGGRHAALGAVVGVAGNRELGIGNRKSSGCALPILDSRLPIPGITISR